MNRPDWDGYFLSIAREVAQRATCNRARVGCVLVDPLEHRVLATGYNGAPAEQPHCLDGGCVLVGGHCTRAIHAETNAIAYAARYGVAVRGAIAYVSYEPLQDGVVPGVCGNCEKLALAAGIEGTMLLVVRGPDAYNR